MDVAGVTWFQEQLPRSGHSECQKFRFLIESYSEKVLWKGWFSSFISTLSGCCAVRVFHTSQSIQICLPGLRHLTLCWTSRWSSTFEEALQKYHNNVPIFTFEDSESLSAAETCHYLWHIGWGGLICPKFGRVPRHELVPKCQLLDVR